jgi:hypothetical protein
MDTRDAPWGRPQIQAAIENLSRMKNVVKQTGKDGKLPNPKRIMSIQFEDSRREEATA